MDLFFVLPVPWNTSSLDPTTLCTVLGSICQIPPVLTPLLDRVTLVTIAPVKLVTGIVSTCLLVCL